MSHEAIAQTFDAWATDGRDVQMEEEHGGVAHHVIGEIGVRAGEQVLDVGCGNGWATRKLAQIAPGVQAIGIDVSPKMIARAEELSSLRIRARYEVCPFEAIDFKDGKFDRVFSVEALYYAVDLEKALAEMGRVLKSGGTTDVVIDYFAESEATAGWADATGVAMHRLSAEAWKSALEAAGFENVRTERIQDPRGAPDESEFEPTCCYPDYATLAKVHEAGSLWIRGKRS